MPLMAHDDRERLWPPGAGGARGGEHAWLAENRSGQVAADHLDPATGVRVVDWQEEWAAGMAVRDDPPCGDDDRDMADVALAEAHQHQVTELGARERDL